MPLRYDANGNHTADGMGGTYAFTPDNIAQSATLAGATTTYRYDGDTLRTLKVDPRGVNHYYLHGPGNQILSEYADPCFGQAPLLLREYVYAGGRLLAAVKPASVAASVAFTQASSTVTELASGTATDTLYVRLTTSNGQPTVCPVSVTYQTQPGTAKATEYTAIPPTTMTFAAGAASGTQQPIAVQIPHDGAYDPNPNVTLSVVLFNPTGGASLGSPTTHTLTVVETDPPPVLSISDASVSQPGGGDGMFSVSTSGMSVAPFTVGYMTADGTATVAEADYGAVSGTLTFPALSTTPQTVRVHVNSNSTYEGDEVFYVNLSSPTGGATLGRSQGTGTIIY